MGKPDISVVIPTRERLAALEGCIAALVAQDFDGKRFEIVVADAAGETAVRKSVGRWAMLTNGAPVIRYVPASSSPGPAGARNLGWRAAKADVIAFTNDTALPHRDWLAEGWKAMQGGATAAAGGANAPDIDAANCFVQRQSLRAVGGFDERFTAGWDDARDLQFTLAEVSGEVVAAPRAIVERAQPRAGWDATLTQYRRMLFDALLFKKHPTLYRERIRDLAPWSYYAIVASLAVTAAGACMRDSSLAWAGLIAWTVLTTALVATRMGGERRTSFTEILATSIAIPPVAVVSRLAGALRFRVFFL